MPRNDLLLPSNARDSSSRAKHRSQDTCFPRPNHFSVQSPTGSLPLFGCFAIYQASLPALVFAKGHLLPSSREYRVWGYWPTVGNGANTYPRKSQLPGSPAWLPPSLDPRTTKGAKVQFSGPTASGTKKMLTLGSCEGAEFKVRPHESTLSTLTGSIQN